MLTINLQATVLEVDRLLTGTLRSCLVVFSSCKCKPKAARLLLYICETYLIAHASHAWTQVQEQHSSLHLRQESSKKLRPKGCYRCVGLGRKPISSRHPLPPERRPERREAAVSNNGAALIGPSPKDSFSPLALLRWLLSGLARERFYEWQTSGHGCMDTIWSSPLHIITPNTMKTSVWSIVFLKTVNPRWLAMVVSYGG